MSPAPLKPVKTAAQCEAEKRQADAKFKTFLRKYNNERPLTQSLGRLLKSAL